jgi:DeoR family myo-inositol catabolism operon transcriptional repressor
MGGEKIEKMKKLFHGESMDNEQRQQQILQVLDVLHFASVAELAERIFVSGATVRRDIAKLQERGLVKTVYGGVVKTRYEKEVVPVSMRDRENSAIKEELAMHAAAYIHDNDTVIFDSSSTVRRICRHIKKRKNLTVITNNLRVCEELKDTNITVLCTGGTLMHRRDCFTGAAAEQFLRGIRATAVFFSSQGLTASGHIVDSSPEETALRRVMLAQSAAQYFLCDPSKTDKEYPYILCHIDEITEKISPEE